MTDIRRLQGALGNARAHLLARRCPHGYWEGRLTSSALATAVAVSALSLGDGQRDAEPIGRGVAWLCNTQNGDGGWGDTPDSPSNLSTTLLGLSALVLAGRPAERALTAARAYVSRNAGGSPAQIAAAVERIYGADRTFAAPILMNCALAGIVRWDSLADLPFELAVLPRAMYGVLGLQVVSYALPALIAVGLSIERHTARSQSARDVLRRLCEPAVRRRLAALQPSHGGFLEATPLTAFVGMAMIGVAGPDDAVVRRCLGFLRSSMRPDGSWPIDTNLATWVSSGACTALSIAGGFDSAEAARLREWLAGQQSGSVHQFTGARAGGWAWTHLPGGVPDADDTAGAILALLGTPQGHGAERGIRWLLGLQNKDGGWPTFCRGWGRLPFDRSSPDITAHAIRALLGFSRSAPDPRIGRACRRAARRGVKYLARVQQADGSWLPLWFGNQAVAGKSNPVLGTARALVAWAEAAPGAREAELGLQYLIGARNDDGGWGGARGVASSVEETALAVTALTCFPSRDREALARGIEYLIRRVENGSWVDARPIGLYFASLWYAEDLYPLIWTIEALGRAAAIL